MPKPGAKFETPTRPLQRSFIDTNDDIHTTPVEQEDEGRERQVISPLPFTPFRSSPPQHQDEQDESNPEERKKAREFARRLEHAVEVLTEVLFYWSFYSNQICKSDSSYIKYITSTSFFKGKKFFK